MHFSDRPGRSLLVVVNVFAPDLGGGVLFSDLCEGLSERGFDVTVRCAYPYYPEWTDKSGRNGMHIERSVENGVKVERFGIFIPPDPNSLLQRLVYEASFMASLTRSLPDRRFDAVMAFCPLAGGVGYAALRKKLYGEPLWLNVQDLPADAAAAGGISSRTGFDPFVRIQSALFNACDFWSTISPVMVERLEGIRRRNQPVAFIPNWLHRSLEQAITRKKETASRGEAVRLFYSGNIGTKQNLLEFCRSLGATRADFSFLIRGSGSRSEAVRNWISESGDSRFRFEPLSSEDAFIESLTAADFFVVPEAPGSGGSFIPSKLIPAIAAGTPVLAISDADSPLGQEVRDNNLGPHFEWTSVGQIGELLENLEQVGHARRKWGQALETRSTFYQRDVVLDEYARLLDELITSRR
jgi:colanic acid biosynthesis glycosyl transferase WcaI